MTKLRTILKSSVNLSTMLLLVILTGCSEEDVISDLRPVDGELTGKEVPISTFIFKPYNIAMMDDMLVVHDRIDSNIFKFFTYPNVEFKFSWGRLGLGPDEISYISSTGFLGRGNTFSFVDQYDFKTYEIDPLHNVSLVERIKLAESFGPLNNLSYLGDSVFITNAVDQINDHVEHVFLYPDRKIGSNFGNFPEEGHEFETYYHKFTWYLKRNVVNPQKKKILVFYMRSNRIKVYDFKGQLEKEIRFTENSPPGVRHTWRTFGNVYGTENYAYVLYSNALRETAPEKIEPLPKDLLILSWDGKVIKRFDLDIPIIDFVVSEKHRKIYGITYLGGDHLIEFDLPNPEQL